VLPFFGPPESKKKSARKQFPVLCSHEHGPRLFFREFITSPPPPRLAFKGRP